MSGQVRDKHETVFRRKNTRRCVPLERVLGFSPTRLLNRRQTDRADLYVSGQAESERPRSVYWLQKLLCVDRPKACPGQDNALCKRTQPTTITPGTHTSMHPYVVCTHIIDYHKRIIMNRVSSNIC